MHPISFTPIDGQFPDFGTVFPTKEPLAEITIDATLLSEMVEVASLDDAMTIRVFDDRIVAESKRKDGTGSRAVLMGLLRHDVPKPVEPEEEEAPVEEEEEKAPPEPVSPKPEHFFHSARRPNPGQRALHTYLLRTRGEEVTVETLEEPDPTTKIEELRSRPAASESFATWPQWRRLYLLLVEANADPREICDVLNDLTGVQETSGLIAERLKRKAA